MGLGLPIQICLKPLHRGRGPKAQSYSQPSSAITVGPTHHSLGQPVQGPTGRRALFPGSHPSSKGFPLGQGSCPWVWLLPTAVGLAALLLSAGGTLAMELRITKIILTKKKKAGGIMLLNDRHDMATEIQTVQCWYRDRHVRPLGQNWGPRNRPTHKPGLF